MRAWIRWIAILADEIRRFVREKKPSNSTFLDEDLHVSMKLYGLTGPIPLKVVIDHEGIIRYAHVGGYPRGEGELSHDRRPCEGDGEGDMTSLSLAVVGYRKSPFPQGADW
jgi:hypothetical protein